ncbi:MAG: hypothetical protein U9Q61_10995, partial [Thermodesulfobacteriota bacterium]|nr:hypothetical protein [Thermodesulfobacteriota bacterium]
FFATDTHGQLLDVKLTIKRQNSFSRSFATLTQAAKNAEETFFLDLKPKDLILFLTLFAIFAALRETRF